jgi:murein DD-endopeptidase MepM/ murein hydrolase activator NlpD
MSNSFYEYDEQSLQVQRIKKGLKHNILRLIKFSSISLAGSIIIFFVFSETINGKKTKRLLEQKEELLDNYSQLESQILDIQKEVYTLKTKDDHLYRPILELSPITSDIRAAGFGGHNRYENLQFLTEGDFVTNVALEIDKINSQLKVQTESYESVIKKAIEKDKKLDSKPGIQPVSVNDFGRISDYYGWRRDPFNGSRRMHYGIDVTGPRGCPVYCTGNGTVSRAEYVRGYGLLVEIDHGYKFKTRYAHLDEISVKVGQKLNRGQVVGKLGNTGRSTGPHLHYEVRYKNKPVNPLDYYRNNLTASEYDEMIELFAKK